MLLIRSQKNLKQKAVYEAAVACHVMKRFVALCVIALTSELSANCDPVDSYTVAVEYNTLLERECSSLMGGGGVYYGKIVEASESSHVSCDGYSVAEGYVVIYGCNTCTSKNIQERLKQDYELLLATCIIKEMMII